jgi:hypothetical protein
MGRTLALILLMVAPAFAQEPPSVRDQIDPTRFDDGSRAIVVRLPHRPEPGEPTSIQLVKSRAYVRRGDAGPIFVEIVNRGGSIADSWRAPRPGARSAEVAPGEEGRYAIPYTKDLSGARITDTELGAAVEMRFDRAIENFCLSQPDDVACDKVDLKAMVSPEVNTPQTVATGESVTIAVTATFENAVGETAGAAMSVAPFFVSPNLQVETENETTATEARIDGAFRHTMRVAYKITCAEPGAGRIFPEAVIFPTAGPAVVDIDPANNRWNTILDVLCTP